MVLNFAITPLHRSHAIDRFTCGSEPLDRFLHRFAFPNQQAGSSRTYIASADDEVVGFYTLVVGQLEYDRASQRMKKGLSRHPIPIMLLARLAISTPWQGRGLGPALLKDAMLRTLQVSEIAGIRALVVHAKDEKAKAFYEKFDFLPSPSDPLHLYLLLKDVRAILGAEPKRSPANG